MQNKKPKRRKQHSKHLTLISLSIQMGLTIYLGSYIGEWLDVKNNKDDDVYKITAVLLSVVISMYMFIKKANKITND